ncbi:hypothetical protein [Streptomyces sp. NPDC088360]|uniref:hypothetical protein n=1 Tax=Streptomyces sp. NPDC088360 TaxID=3154515 RepID=UPI00344BFF06
MSDSRDPMDETTVLVTAADVTLEPIGARALLVDRDALLAPDPPPLLAEPQGELVAVITPVPADSGPVERIAVVGVERLGSDVSATDATGATGATGVPDVPEAPEGPGVWGAAASVVRLAGRSRYVVRAESFTQRRLTEALLAEGGDLWAAMRTLGYDSPVPPDRPGRVGLSGAGARVGAGAGASEDELDAFAAGPCRVIRTCFPHPPRPDDPPSPDGPRPPRPGDPRPPRPGDPRPPTRP